MSNLTITLSENQDIISCLDKINVTDFAVYHLIEKSKTITQQEIADIIGKHIVTVKRAISKLKRLDLVTVIKQGRRNTYRVFLDKTGSENGNTNSIENGSTIGIIPDVNVNKQTTTNDIQTQEDKYQVTDDDLDNAKRFDIALHLEACSHPPMSMNDAFTGKYGKDGQLVSEVLAEWVKADKTGTLDLTGKNGKPMTANLIAAKIIDGDTPPLKPEPNAELVGIITPDDDMQYESPDEIEVTPTISEPEIITPESEKTGVWDECLAVLETRLPDMQYQACFAGSTGEIDGNRLLITLNSANVEWAKNRMMKQVSDAAKQVAPELIPEIVSRSQ